MVTISEGRETGRHEVREGKDSEQEREGERRSR